MAQSWNPSEERGDGIYNVVVAGASDLLPQYVDPLQGVLWASFFVTAETCLFIYMIFQSRHGISPGSLLFAVLLRVKNFQAIFRTTTRGSWSGLQNESRLGGGSLTALPIIETQAATFPYIPTNVISSLTVRFIWCRVFSLQVFGRDQRRPFGFPCRRAAQTRQ